MRKILKFSLTLIIIFSSIDIKAQISLDKLLATNDTMYFAYSNDTIKQYLYVFKEAKNIIQFKLVSITPGSPRVMAMSGSGEVKSVLEGLAFLKETEDMELDNDDMNNGYFVNEYVYSKKCTLRIRIAAENADKARVFDENCNRKGWLEYESIGVMKRKDYTSSPPRRVANKKDDFEKFPKKKDPYN